MAALQSQTPCPDCDCSDSPLSVTGNILGILTFAVAVYASLLYYYRGFRASKLEQSDMFYKVLLAKEELAKIRSEIQDLEILDDLKIAWQQFDTTLISTENDIEEVYRLLTGQRFEISDTDRDGRQGPEYGISARGDQGAEQWPPAGDGRRAAPRLCAGERVRGTNDGAEGGQGRMMMIMIADWSWHKHRR